MSEQLSNRIVINQVVRSGLGDRLDVEVNGTKIDCFDFSVKHDVESSWVTLSLNVAELSITSQSV